MVVHTTVELVFVATIPLDDPLHSHNMIRMFSPGVGHMHDNIYLHVQQIGRMYSIGSLASLPSYAYICTPHVYAHILGK